MTNAIKKCTLCTNRGAWAPIPLDERKASGTVCGRHYNTAHFCSAACEQAFRVEKALKAPNARP